MFLIYFISIVASVSKTNTNKSNLKISIPALNEVKMLSSNVIDSLKDKIAKTTYKESSILPELKDILNSSNKDSMDVLQNFIEEKIQESILGENENTINFKDTLRDTIFDNLEPFNEYFPPNTPDNLRRFQLQIIYLTVRFFIFLIKNLGFIEKKEEVSNIIEYLIFILCSLVDHTYLERQKYKKHHLLIFTDEFFLKVLKNHNIQIKNETMQEKLKKQLSEYVEYSYLKYLKVIKVGKSNLNIINSIIDSLNFILP